MDNYLGIKWGFDFEQAQFGNNEDDITTPLLFNDILSEAEHLVLTRDSKMRKRLTVSRGSANWRNHYRKIGYIQCGDRMDNPYRVMQPEETRLKQMYSKQMPASNDNHWDDGWAIVYHEDDTKLEALRDKVSAELQKVVSEGHDLNVLKRKDNLYNVFVFKRLDDGHAEFEGVFRYLYDSSNSKKKYIVQNDRMLDRYSFSAGNLSVILSDASGANREKFIGQVEYGVEAQYPFIACPRPIGFSADWDGLVETVKELDSGGSLCLINTREYSDEKDLAEDCKRLKDICSFFCVNIYIVMFESDIPKRAEGVKIKDYFTEIGSVDCLIDSQVATYREKRKLA